MVRVRKTTTCCSTFPAVGNLLHVPPLQASCAAFTGCKCRFLVLEVPFPQQVDLGHQSWIMRIVPKFQYFLRYPPSLHGLQKHADEDESNAEIEGEVYFTSFAKDEEGEDDGVAGLEVVGQVDGKGREAF